MKNQVDTPESARDPGRSRGRTSEVCSRGLDIKDVTHVVNLDMAPLPIVDRGSKTRWRSLSPKSASDELMSH